MSIWCMGGDSRGWNGHHTLEVLMPFLPYELGGKEAWTTFRKALERDDVPSLVSLKCCLTHERT